MDIYKIHDFDEDKGDTGFLRITELRQGVKNPDRVNVFVNGKYGFSLDIAQVVELSIKVGREISKAEFDGFKKASEFGKLYQRTLEWVLVRPRSEKETRDYLYKKIYEKKLEKDYIDIVISKLKNKKYIDDEKFTEWYIENRFVKKGVSVKRLKMELMKKGVAKGIIEEKLDESDRNDEAEIRKIIARKRARYDDEKLIAYLCRQGFPYDLVREIVLTPEKD